MNTQTQEALKMLFDAVEKYRWAVGHDANQMAWQNVCDLLDGECKEALAQPAQEPVAWMSKKRGDVSKAKMYFNEGEEILPLYTHPAPLWQKLEFMELYKIWFEFVMPKDENGKRKERFGYDGVLIQEIEEFARAIEQALKEKNT